MNNINISSIELTMNRFKDSFDSSEIFDHEWATSEPSLRLLKCLMVVTIHCASNHAQCQQQCTMPAITSDVNNTQCQQQLARRFVNSDRQSMYQSFFSKMDGKFFYQFLCWFGSVLNRISFSNKTKRFTFIIYCDILAETEGGSKF